MKHIISKNIIFIDWAIREENLLRIQSSYDRVAIVDVERGDNEALLKLETDSTSDPRWKKMLQTLIKQFGKETYSWFSKMELDSEKDGVLKIKTSSGFAKEWIETYHGRELHSIGGQYFTRKDLFYRKSGKKNHQ